MHELGLVTYVADTVQKIAAEQEIPRIDGVTLTIGEVSGLIPEYLADCWNYFRKRYPALTEAELTWQTEDAVSYCDDCKQEFGTVAAGKICPYCGSEHTWLLRGNGCSIKELTILEE